MPRSVRLKDHWAEQRLFGRRVLAAPRFVAWGGVAGENEKIPTSRARRTATVATLAASEAVKRLGTRAANVTRTGLGTLTEMSVGTTGRNDLDGGRPPGLVR